MICRISLDAIASLASLAQRVKHIGQGAQNFGRGVKGFLPDDFDPMLTCIFQDFVSLFFNVPPLKAQLREAIVQKIPEFYEILS